MFDFGEIKVTVGGYTMDIAPILEALAKFVAAILNAYLPEDLKDVASDLEELA